MSNVCNNQYTDCRLNSLKLEESISRSSSFQQRTLTPPDIWSCPTLELACVLILRPNVNLSWTCPWGCNCQTELLVHIAVYIRWNFLICIELPSVNVKRVVVLTVKKSKPMKTWRHTSIEFQFWSESHGILKLQSELLNILAFNMFKTRLVLRLAGSAQRSCECLTLLPKIFRTNKLEPLFEIVLLHYFHKLNIISTLIQFFSLALANGVNN